MHSIQLRQFEEWARTVSIPLNSGLAFNHLQENLLREESRLNPFEFRACIQSYPYRVYSADDSRLNPFEFRACIQSLTGGNMEFDVLSQSL